MSTIFDREQLVSIDEERGSLRHDIKMLSEKFEGLDVAEVLLKLPYKDEELLIKFEKHWVKHPEGEASLILMIADKSGLFNLCSLSYKFSLMSEYHPPNMPLHHTVYCLNHLVNLANEKRKEIQIQENEREKS